MNLKKNKIVGIHQPNYIPWLGFFNRMKLVDAFVFFDHVELSSGKTLTTRNKVRLRDEWLWLTVPVLTGGLGSQKIYEVRIDYKQNWVRKHQGTLDQAYRHSPYFEHYRPSLFEIYDRRPDLLSDLNIALIQFISTALNITCETVKSSEFEIEGGQTKDIIKICQRLDATEYISGAGGALDFLKPEQFSNAGIDLKIQHIKYPEYPQQGNGFITNLSALDLLFNCGPESSQIVEGAGIVTSL